MPIFSRIKHFINSIGSYAEKNYLFAVKYIHLMPKVKSYILQNITQIVPKSIIAKYKNLKARFPGVFYLSFLTIKCVLAMLIASYVISKFYVFSLLGFAWTAFDTSALSFGFGQIIMDISIRILAFLDGVPKLTDSTSEFAIVNNYISSPQLLMCSVLFYGLMCVILGFWIFKMVVQWTQLSKFWQVFTVAILVLLLCLVLYAPEAYCATTSDITQFPPKKPNFLQQCYNVVSNTINMRSPGAYTLQQGKLAIADQLSSLDLRSQNQLLSLIDQLNTLTPGSYEYNVCQGQLQQLASTMKDIKIVATNGTNIALRMEASEITLANSLTSGVVQGMGSACGQVGTKVALRTLGIDKIGSIAGIGDPSSPTASAFNLF